MPRDGRTVWYVPSNLLVLDIDARGRVLLTGNEAGGVTAGAIAGESRDRDLLVGRIHGTRPRVARRPHRAPVGPGRDRSRLQRPAPAHGRLGAGQDRTRSRAGAVARREMGALDHAVRTEPRAAPPDGSRRATTDRCRRSGSERRRLRRQHQSDGRGRRHTQRIARRGRRRRLVRQAHALDLAELRGRAFSVRRFLGTHTSPDGSLLAVQADDGKVLAWPLPNGGPARELATLGDDEVFVGWSAETARIYVATWNGPKARIDSLDVSHRPALDSSRDHGRRSRRRADGTRPLPERGRPDLRLRFGPDAEHALSGDGTAIAFYFVSGAVNGGSGRTVVSTIRLWRVSPARRWRVVVSAP